MFVFLIVFSSIILFNHTLPVTHSSLHKNPSNFQPSGSPTLNTSTTAIPFPPSRSLNLFPEVHQRFWLVWAVELASQAFSLGAVWHFFIRVVPWITWMRIPKRGRWKVGEFMGNSQKRAPFLKGGIVGQFP